MNAHEQVLVAGIGNVFLSDDGFGVEVVRRLAGTALPAGVKVQDVGIRGIHLAYDLLDGGYGTTILVDAMPRGEAPGTVYLLEPDLEGLERAEPGVADGHSIDPRSVFRLLSTLGGSPGKVLIVGCEPASVEEGMGLSPPVAAAVDEAVKMIRRLVEPAGGASEGGDETEDLEPPHAN